MIRPCRSVSRKVVWISIENNVLFFYLTWWLLGSLKSDKNVFKDCVDILMGLFCALLAYNDDAMISPKEVGFFELISVKALSDCSLFGLPCEIHIYRCKSDLIQCFPSAVIQRKKRRSRESWILSESNQRKIVTCVTSFGHLKRRQSTHVKMENVLAKSSFSKIVDIRYALRILLRKPAFKLSLSDASSPATNKCKNDEQ